MRAKPCIAWAAVVLAALVFPCTAPAAPGSPTPQPSPTAASTPAIKLNLNLRGSYRLAIDNSPRLSELRSKIYELRGKVDEAYSAAYPTFELGAGLNVTTPNFTTNGGASVITPYLAHNVSLYVHQAIFTFGRLRWSTSMAELSQKSGQESYRQAVEFLFDDVATAYHDAILAKTNVGILAERVEALQAQLRDSESLFKRGTVARFDVLRSEAEFSNYQQQLIAAQNNARLAADQLLNRLGLPLGQEINLEEEARPGAPPQELERNTAQALEKRPELGVIQWALESAKARIRYESSQNNPRLDAYSTATERNPTAAQGYQVLVTGVQLSVPLWDGGLTTSRIAQATHIVEQLAQQLENGRRSVRLEVREAFNTLQNLWIKKDVSEKAREQAAEAFRVARIRYKAGVSTQVELLSAQAAYADAEFAQAQTWHDYHLAWARWRRVVSDEYPAYVPGPLLRERAPETPKPME